MCSLLDENGVFGAVGLGQAREFEGVLGQRSITPDDTVPDVVKVKDVRRDREAAPLALTEISVDHYLHNSPNTQTGADLTTW